MTYSADELSVQSGQPIFFYEFISGSQEWRYTSSPDEQTWNSYTWEASPIVHDDITQSEEIHKDGISLVVPRTNPIASQFLGYSPDTITSVTIYRKHEASSDALVYWKGRVVSSNARNQEVKIECESIFTSMRRPGLRARYQKMCRHAVYIRGCRLDKEDFRAWSRIATISANGVSLTLSAADTITGITIGVPITGTITGITRGTTTTLTVTHTYLKTGDIIGLTDIVGTTELNDLFFVATVSGNTITIGIDSTLFTAYVSGGVVTAARTLTELTIADPIIEIGNDVTIASVTGTTQLNGNTYAVLDVSGTTVTIEADSGSFTPYVSGGTATPTTVADLQTASWYLGGLFWSADTNAFRMITSHSGSNLTLTRPVLGMAAGDKVKIYPGCDRGIVTCNSKFNNIANFGGFPWIPSKNPFGGSSIV